MPPAIGIGTILGGLGSAATVAGALGAFGGDDGGSTPSGDASAAIARDMYGSTAQSRGNFIDMFNQLTGGGGGYSQNSGPGGNLGSIGGLLGKVGGAVDGVGGFGSQGSSGGSGGLGMFNIASHPMFAPLKQGYESQYQNAEDNIMGQTPAGGQLYDLLAQNEMSRATGLGAAGGDILTDMLNKAYGASFNAPGQALMGLQTANQAEQFGQQQNQQMWGNIGNFVGGGGIQDILGMFGV